MSYRKRTANILKRSVAPLIATTIVASAVSAWAANPAVCWDAQADFEAALVKQNLDLTSSPGDVKVVLSKDFTSTSAITCVTPTKIYTTAANSNTVSVINTATKEVTAIPLPGPAAGIVYNSAFNKVYVGQRDGNSVTVIDTLTDQSHALTIGTATTGVYAAAYNADAQKVYLTNIGDQTITVINASNDSLRATLPVTAGATTAAYDGAANPRVVYLTNSGNNYVTAIDGDGDQVVQSLPVAPIYGILGGLSPNLASLGITSGDHIELTASGEPSDSLLYSVNGGTYAALPPTGRLYIPYSSSTAFDVKLAYDGVSSPVLHSVCLNYFFKINASASAGGSISSAGDTIVDYNNDSPTYNFTPQTGYHISEIKVDNVPLPEPLPNSYTFSGVKGNHTIMVNYAVNLPDMTATIVSAPPSAVVGQQITVNTTINNIGQINSGSVLNRLYLCPTPAWDTAVCTQIGVTIGAGAAAHGSTPLTFMPTLSWSLKSGDYYLVLATDATKVLTESNEDNNTASSLITLSYGADLVITNLAPPSTASAGANISVAVDVTNQGVSYAAPSFTALYMCDTPQVSKQACSEIGRTTNPTSITVGGTNHISALIGRIPAGTPAGTKYIGAIADVTGLVGESNEDNNDDYPGVPIIIN